ncbi:MAG: aminotransferase class V-fold PLP-dependent enzyme, partial [Rickettsiales bacterium]|nr:aminotransferase class V-fold PLP-dependent enzyme [Rickettsiales bacterium]
NETGVIQPVREVVELCRPLGIRVHCDVVQGLGKIPVDMGVLGVDMMTLAAHKMGGPVGAAARVVRQGYATKTHILGGGQELNRRAGTENVAALAGWAKALELSAQGNWQPQVREWFEALEVQLMAAGAEVLGHAAPRLPNTLSVRMPHMKAETQLMHFDLCGLAVSAGSACSSGRIEPSAVIQAMGVPAKEAAEVIRVSAGWATQPSDLEAFAQAWLKLAKRAKIT